MNTEQRLKIMITGCTLLSGCVSVYATEKPEIKPNFIIINCDDLGYGDLGCFGHPTILTPNLDKMAFEGQKWTNFYVSAAVSSPSRAGLLTGRLGVRTGMYGNEREVLFPDSPEGLSSEELTIASILKEAGYVNACVGKWHLGHQEEAMPWNHGFIISMVFLFQMI